MFINVPSFLYMLNRKQETRKTKGIDDNLHTYSPRDKTLYAATTTDLSNRT